jgi:thiol-disulfide isomerase/thioredoxin
LVVSLFFSGCEQKHESQAQTPTVQTAQSYTFNQLGAKPLEVIPTAGRIPKFQNLTFPEYAGKIVFLDFFKTDCNPCRSMIPHLENLQKKYKDQMVILGVLVEDRPLESIADFVKFFNISYPIIEPGKNYELTELVGGVSAVPTMVIYNPKGEYVTHYLGAIPEAMIENDIKRILQKDKQ